MAKEDSKKQYDYAFKVLKEQVATDDLFEDKTHERVATTLKSFISSADAGLTIGLEGGWGSGKSTVINILKNKFEQDNDKTLFFTFDAWAHDGDPLRKIFLESLLSSIDPHQQNETLNDLREQVSARKKSVKVKTEKSASRLGKILSLSALPIPVGAAFISAVNYEKLMWPWASDANVINYTFLFGLLFSFSPIFALLYWCFNGDKDANTDKTKWDVFESQSEESYTQDITEDGERTSIEFEKFFNTIISYVFSKESDHNYRRVVIVIDNLDRVDADYAQTIWSTLQTFFQHRSSSINGGQKEDWVDKLWFLIPYDREGLRQAWSVNNTNKDDEQCKVATSFMEKCFQIVAEVPTPVMSAWIKYLERCTEQSFVGWPVSTIKEFNESYIRCMSKLHESPSPRQIHNHVNRAGMLAMHWQEEVSAEAICLYTLYRQSKTEADLRMELLDEGLPENYPNHKPIELLKPQLAGMLFGVSPEKGIQLLLTPQIKASLTSGDGEKLADLADTHQQAFWLAFRACSNEWLVTDAHTDMYKINTITALHTAFKSPDNNLSPFIEKIKEAFLQSFDNWKLSEYSYKEAVKSLAEMLPSEKEFLLSLNGKLKNRLSKTINDIDNEKFSPNEMSGLAELESFLNTSNHPLKTRYYNKLDLNNWQQWLKHCESENIQFQSVLPNKTTFTQLVDNAGFNVASLNKEIFDTLVVTYQKYSDQSVWKTLPSSLITWFNIANREILANEQYCLAIKLFASASSHDVKAIKECIQGAAFWQRAAHSDISNNPSLPFLVALAEPDFRNNKYVSATVKNLLNEKLSEDEILEGYEYFKSSNDLDAIWKLAKIEENIFARQILNSVTEKELYSVGAIYVDEVNWKDEKEVSSAIEKLCEFGAIKHIEESIKEDPQTYNKTIYLLQRYGDADSKYFVSNLLDSLSREDWLEALKENNDLLKCIPDNNSSFGKAWGEHFKLIVSGEQTEPDVETFKYQFELKNKVLDLESIYTPHIALKYFEDTDKDHLSEESFAVISPFLLPVMKDISQKNYEIRLSNWIETDSVSRIQWFLKADINNLSEPIETIVAGVSAKLKVTEDAEFDLYKQLNQKLKLGIDVKGLLSKEEKPNVPAND